MNNPFKRSTAAETVVHQEIVSDIDRNSIELLRAARQAQASAIELAARQQHQVMLELAAQEKVPNLLLQEVRTIRDLRAMIHRKENDYYYSRAGRRAAIALLANTVLELNPGMKQKSAISQAESQLTMYKQFQNHTRHGKRLGRVKIAPNPELPELFSVDAEAIDTGIWFEQAWQLQFSDRSARSVDILHINRQTDNDKLHVATPLFHLAATQPPHEPELRTPDGLMAAESDHFL